MVATDQEMVQGKNFSLLSGKSQGISLRVRENLSLGKKLGKREILRVHIYFLLYFKFFYTFYGHESCCIGIMSVKLNAS